MRPTRQILTRQHALQRAPVFLRLKWRRMPEVALKRYLRTLLIVEYRAYPKRIRSGWESTDRRFRARLRWQRLQVATYLEAQGVRMSPLVRKWALPHGAKWPGAARLVPLPGEGQQMAEDVDA